MNEPRVLLVEDDPTLAELLLDYLSRHGFAVERVEDGEVGAARIEARPPDLVLLDLMLPRLDGMAVCRRVRPRYRGPILMLTARVEDLDEILGLEAGADDYVRKPVDPRVLVARIRAALRRAPHTLHATDKLVFGDVVIDAARHEMTVAGVDAGLTTAEFELVWTLAERAGQVVSREELHQLLRGVAYDGLDRSIDLRVSRARRRLGGALKERIRSVRGAGYLWAVDR